MTNIDVFTRYLAAIDNHDETGVRAALTADTRVEAPGGVSLSGIEEVAVWIGVFWRAFPDLRHEILTSVESGDRASAEVRFTGTHTGPMASPDGDIPPTGKPFDFTYTHTTEFADGAVASDHVVYDQLGFLSQLGLMGS